MGAAAPNRAYSQVFTLSRSNCSVAVEDLGDGAVGSGDGWREFERLIAKA
jgi:hypothetical protein